MFKVVAYQIAASINIRQCRSLLPIKILFSNSDELFLENGAQKYTYVFQYGIVSFFNHSDEEIHALLDLIKSATKGYLTEHFSESIQVEIKQGRQTVAFDKVILPGFEEEAIRLVMLNTSQSVALDRYSEITEDLLEETQKHNIYLEQHGKLSIRDNEIKRFLGKVLNIKNQITENLYIFDAPDSTWENEKLNLLNHELKQTFDLKIRYRSIHERIEIIKESLGLYKDIMYHKESSRLEWIIIILILVEVVDLFVFRILN